MHTHPDDTHTARAALARQDLADALFLLRRVRIHWRDGTADRLPLTDKNRNDYADALDAVEQLVHHFGRQVA